MIRDVPLRTVVWPLALAGVMFAACRPLPPARTDPGAVPADSRTPPPARAAGDTVPPVPDSPAVEELREGGPAYIPYDTSPQTVWDTDAQAMLTRTLSPVLRDQSLPAGTRARYWILVREDGHVADAVLQTSSENDPFDEAAARVALQLRFLPALRADRPVPAWIVREISLLMQ